MDFDINRSVPALGTDLVLNEDTEGGDLAVTAYGDIDVVSQINNLKLAIKRRIFTPLGGMGAFVQDINGLYNIDSTYGNSAYRYLSEPLNGETLDAMKDALIQCLSQEPRIILYDVIPAIKSNADGSTTVDFKAEYQIIETQTEDNFVISYDPSRSYLF